ncbi:hypothetical protein ACLB1E_03215 [Escherichia coli]
MVNVAKEMERRASPLQVTGSGGATTSKAHTAVKIEQNYSGPDGVCAGIALAHRWCGGGAVLDASAR